jgi:VWFA-related protein
MDICPFRIIEKSFSKEVVPVYDNKNFRKYGENNLQRSIVLLALLIMSATFLVAQTAKPTPPQEDDVVKISTTLIQLDVAVTDRSGKPITDLRPEEIEIYENGEKQRITNLSFISSARTVRVESEKRDKSVQAVQAPAPVRELKPDQIRRTIALVVDDLGLSFDSTYQVRRALKRFVEEQMRDGDLIAIIRTGGGIGALQQFTSDKRMLYAAIEKVVWNPKGRSGIAAFEPINDLPGSVLNEDAEDKKSREEFEKSADDFRDSAFTSGTLGALKYIVGGMGELPGRKSVIFFSDGFTLYNPSESGSSTVTEYVRKLIDQANRAAVVFYTIDSRGLQDAGITAADKVEPNPGRIAQVMSERRGELFETQSGLIVLAKETGGLAYYNQNKIYEGVQEAMDDQSYYLVAYQPDSDTFDPKTRRFNRIDVKVTRPNTLVRYRSGFFNIEDSVAAKKVVPTSQIQQLNYALSSPFALNNIQLRLNTLFGSGVYGTFITSLLHIDTRDVKFTEGPNGTKRAVLDILAITFGDNGVPVDSLARTLTFDIKPEVYEAVLRDGFVCNFSFPVKQPGAFQFRVAVRDSQAQTVGSANQFVQIPDITKKRLSMSGILVEKFSPAQWREFSGEAPPGAKHEEATDPYADSSIRRFQRGNILRFGFEAYNARLDANGRAWLKTRIRLYKDDKLIMEGPAQPVDTTGQSSLDRIHTGGAINLTEKMLPGEYTLQIIVTDELGKGKHGVSSQFVQFEIIE